MPTEDRREEISKAYETVRYQQRVARLSLRAANIVGLPVFSANYFIFPNERLTTTYLPLIGLAVLNAYHHFVDKTGQVLESKLLDYELSTYDIESDDDGAEDD